MSERGVRHSFERRIARGMATRKESFYHLDYPTDFLILMKDELGDEEDWKWISEQLPYYYSPVEKE
jgi:hypothetical protein